MFFCYLPHREVKNQRQRENDHFENESGVMNVPRYVRSEQHRPCDQQNCQSCPAPWRKSLRHFGNGVSIECESEKPEIQDQGGTHEQSDSSQMNGLNRWEEPGILEWHVSEEVRSI